MEPERKEDDPQDFRLEIKKDEDEDELVLYNSDGVAVAANAWNTHEGNIVIKNDHFNKVITLLDASKFHKDATFNWSPCPKFSRAGVTHQSNVVQMLIVWKDKKHRAGLRNLANVLVGKRADDIEPLTNVLEDGKLEWSVFKQRYVGKMETLIDSLKDSPFSIMNQGRYQVLTRGDGSTVKLEAKKDIVNLSGGSELFVTSSKDLVVSDELIKILSRGAKGVLEVEPDNIASIFVPLRLTMGVYEAVKQGHRIVVMKQGVERYDDTVNILEVDEDGNTSVKFDLLPPVNGVDGSSKCVDVLLSMRLGTIEKVSWKSSGNVSWASFFWFAHSPTIRNVVIDIFVGDTAWITDLKNAIIVMASAFSDKSKGRIVAAGSFEEVSSIRNFALRNSYLDDSTAPPVFVISFSKGDVASFDEKGGKGFPRLKHERHEAMDEHEKMMHGLASIEIEIGAHEDERTRLGRQVTDLEGQIKAVSEQLEESKEEHAALKRRTDEEKKDGDTTIADLRRAIDELNDSVSRETKEKDAAAESVKRIEAELNDVQERENKLKSKLESAVSKSNTDKDEISRLKIELRGITSEKERIEQEHDAKAAEVERKDAEIAVLNTQVESLNKELNGVSAKLSDEQGKLRDVEISLEKQRSEIIRQKQSIEHLTNERNKYREQFRLTSISLDKFKAERKAMEEEVRNIQEASIKAEKMFLISYTEAASKKKTAGLINIQLKSVTTRFNKLMEVYAGKLAEFNSLETELSRSRAELDAIHGATIASHKAKERATEEFESKRSQTTTLEVEVAKLSSDIRTTMSTIEVTKETIDQLINERDELKKEITVLDNNLIPLQREMDELKGLNAELESKIKTNSDHIADNEAKVKNLKSTLQYIEDEVAKNKEVLRRQTADIESKNRKLETLEASIESLNTQKEGLLNETKDLEDKQLECKRLEASIKSQQTTLNDLETSLNSAQSEFTSVTESLTKLREDASKLSAQVTELKKEDSEMRTEVARLVTNRKAISGELEDMRNPYSELRDSIFQEGLNRGHAEGKQMCDSIVQPLKERVGGLESDLNSRSDEVADLNRQLESKQREHAAKVKSLQQQLTLITEKSAELREISLQTDEQKILIESLEKQISDLGEKKDAEVEALQQKIQHLETEHESCTSNLEKSKAEHEKLLKAKQDLEKRLKTGRSRYTELDDEKKKLEKQLIESKDREDECHRSLEESFIPSRDDAVSAASYASLEDTKRDDVVRGRSSAIIISKPSSSPEDTFVKHDGVKPVRKRINSREYGRSKRTRKNDYEDVDDVRGEEGGGGGGGSQGPMDR